MKKNTSIIAVMCALVLLLISACSSTSVMDIDGTASGSSIVNFKNSAVDVKVLNTKSRFINGLLKVNVELESGISSPYQLDYKFTWYDSGGMAVDAANSPWIPLYLNGREAKTIQGLAPNSSAKTFKITIKEATTD